MPKRANQKDRASYRRLNITIREDQYQLLADKKLSISALIRDLIDDRFCSNAVTFQLSAEGKDLYDNLVGNFGLHDSDLEDFFLAAINSFLEGKIEQLEELRNRLNRK
ncbi:MAG: hypothetical protein KDD66_04500 [Bdellovibrionales bacterium]|nr:hypothetical protein [Bdellovibrionales bacterium]